MTCDECSLISLTAKSLLPRTNDTYLPREIVAALTKKDEFLLSEDPTSFKSFTGTARKRPDNVWHYRRREKFKHLTEDTVCICGSGKDISFLYDAMPTERLELHVQDFEEQPSEVQFDRKITEQPNHLVPEEFFYVKKKGTVPLSYHEEKPNSRFEVMKLRNSMHNMLNKAGLNEFITDSDTMTQMHNLLELVKKEQDIYNVIFHEIIRQVSVDCLERGELLAEIRRRYANLFSKVPDQIQSLYQEVLSQRALDRRLTDELLRFKKNLIKLSQELAEIKFSDIKIKDEVNATRKALKEALIESDTNAKSLKEYQELYDLQRHRLEKHMHTMILERDLWCKTAYNLAIKIIQEGQWLTAKRLIIYEKQWRKVCQQYAIKLSDQDTSYLIIIQDKLQQWKKHLEEYSLEIADWEETSKCRLENMHSDMSAYVKYVSERLGKFEFTSSSTFQLTDEVYKKLVQWEQILTDECPTYSGTVPISRIEKLKRLLEMQKMWEDMCFKLLERHNPSQTQITKMNEAHKEMKTLIEDMKSQNQILIIGDNGAAKGLLKMTEKVEFLTKRLNYLSKTPKFFDPLEQDNLQELLVDINDGVRMHILSNLSMVERPPERRVFGPKKRITCHEVIKSATNWFNIILSILDSQDAKLLEQVSQFHLRTIMWICHLLVHLCPDSPECSKEALEMLYSSFPSPEDVSNEATLIFPIMEMLTNKIARSVNEMKDVESYFPKTNLTSDSYTAKILKQPLDDNEDVIEINHMKSNCAKWINIAKLLLNDVLERTATIYPNIQVSQSVMNTLLSETIDDVCLLQYIEKLSSINKPIKSKESNTSVASNTKTASLKEDSTPENLQYPGLKVPKVSVECQTPWLFIHRSGKDSIKRISRGTQTLAEPEKTEKHPETTSTQTREPKRQKTITKESPKTKLMKQITPEKSEQPKIIEPEKVMDSPKPLQQSKPESQKVSEETNVKKVEVVMESVKIAEEIPEPLAMPSSSESKSDSSLKLQSDFLPESKIDTSTSPDLKVKETLLPSKTPTAQYSSGVSTQVSNLLKRKTDLSDQQDTIEMIGSDGFTKTTILEFYRTQKAQDLEVRAEAAESELLRYQEKAFLSGRLNKSSANADPSSSNSDAAKSSKSK
ncbi:axonemal dynein light chain domain-containing protein 1-like [Argonauta hians]